MIVKEQVTAIPQASSQRPITCTEIFGFGFGGLANNISSMIVAAYVIYFLTDVAGLSSAAAGGIYLVSKALDAICDPLIGALSDRTISRWGRYHPYMMFGGLMSAVTYILLFTAVPLSNEARIAYYLVVYCLWSVGFTLTVMPYQSVVALLGDNRQKRNIIVAVGKLVSAPVGLIVAFAHQFVDYLGKGDVAAGWQRMIFFFAVIVTVSMWICAFSIRRFDTRENAQLANANPKGQRYTLKERSAVILGNKALFMLVIAFGTNNFADTCLSSTQNYYAKYVLNDLHFISSVGTIATVLTVPIFIAAPFLTKYFNKRDIFKAATLIHIVFPVVLLLFGPEHKTLILSPRQRNAVQHYRVYDAARLRGFRIQALRNHQRRAGGLHLYLLQQILQRAGRLLLLHNPGPGGLPAQHGSNAAGADHHHTVHEHPHHHLRHRILPGDGILPDSGTFCCQRRGRTWNVNLNGAAQTDRITCTPRVSAGTTWGMPSGRVCTARFPPQGRCIRQSSPGTGAKRPAS